ncbi:MAG: hypothetical protein NUV82_02785, partial [Candidatus Komeilibacteria bacterium]|nr:hypothetical protein [Candidatus Komeilibacteria bacterium]
KNNKVNMPDNHYYIVPHQRKFIKRYRGEDIFEDREEILVGPNMESFYDILHRPSFHSSHMIAEYVIKRDVLSHFIFGDKVTCRGTASKGLVEKSGHKFIEIVPADNINLRIYILAGGDKWVFLKQVKCLCSDSRDA